MESATIWLREAETTELIKFFIIVAGLSIFISIIIAFKLKRYPLLAVQLSVFVILLVSPWICTYSFLLEQLGRPKFSEHTLLSNYDSMVFLTYLIAGPVSIVISFWFLPLLRKEEKSGREVGTTGKLKRMFWFSCWVFAVILGAVWFFFGSIKLWDGTKTGTVFFQLLRSNAFGLLTTFVAAGLLYVCRKMGVVQKNE